MIATYQCNKCHAVLPCDPENFRRKSQRPDGLEYKCKPCARKADKFYREGRYIRDPHAERQKELDRLEKQREIRKTDAAHHEAYVHWYTAWNEKVRQRKIALGADDFVRGGTGYVREGNAWKLPLVRV